MNIRKLDQSGRLGEWAQMVSRCRNSGKTVSAWCEENGINKKTYYYRLKRVCEAISEKAKPNGLPLPKEVSEPTFAEVMPAHTIKDAVITVRFGSAEMVIRNGAEPSIVEAVLRALSRIC